MCVSEPSPPYHALLLGLSVNSGISLFLRPLPTWATFRHTSGVGD